MNYKKENLKRAPFTNWTLTSFLSALCLSLLVPSTFALFTDSQTISGNKVSTKSLEIIEKPPVQTEQSPPKVLPAVSEIIVDGELEKFKDESFRSMEAIVVEFENKGRTEAEVSVELSDMDGRCGSMYVALYKEGERKDTYKGKASDMDVQEFVLASKRQLKLHLWFTTPDKEKDISCDLEFEAYTLQNGEKNEIELDDIKLRFQEVESQRSHKDNDHGKNRRWGK